MQRQAGDDGIKPLEVQQQSPARICNICFLLQQIKLVNEKLLDTRIKLMNKLTNFEMTEEKWFFFHEESYGHWPIPMQRRRFAMVRGCHKFN
ncbi:hypothetical protein KQX54_014704 [Cotesia glomerata]|uniref:Uncharacterized protein n=1 Tax=Cotesia glomerata TaxID=32391 RepID=A0AAV7IDS0_COTGL|nr:hypothetical protein KQX54_014704 [Cotesia glomerata]